MDSAWLRRCFVVMRVRLDFGQPGEITEHGVAARTVRVPFHQVAMRSYVMQASVFAEQGLVTQRTIAVVRRFDSQGQTDGTRHGRRE
jgi:hypothetical protein